MKHTGSSTPAPNGLILTGPLVTVQLTLHPSHLKQLEKHPPPIVAKMLVDTGAHRTFVENSVCEQLGLTPLRYDSIVGVSAVAKDCPVYLMSVGLTMAANPTQEGSERSTYWYTNEVVGLPDQKSPSHKGLIGRDFLAAFRLVYDGPTATYELIDRRDALRKVAPEAPIAQPPGPPPRGGKKTPKTKARRKSQRAARRKNRN